MFTIRSIDTGPSTYVPGALRNGPRVERVSTVSQVGEVEQNSTRDNNDDSHTNKLLNRYLNSSSTRDTKELLYASEIMSTPVRTVLPEDSIDHASALFIKYRFRHVPVCSQSGSVVGMVSDRLLLGHAVASAEARSHSRKFMIKDLMVKKVLTGAPETLIREIARSLFEERIGALPITDVSGIILGMVTRSDILRALVVSGPIRVWA